MKKNVSQELVEVRQRSVMIRLTGTFLGGALILNSYIANAVFNESDISALSAMIGAIILGAPIIIGAVSDIVRREHKMRELVALALIACFALEDYRIAGIVAFFMLIADLIERRAALGAQEAIEGVLALSPRKARILHEDGSEEEIEAEKVKPGEIVLIRPGENVPADGVILEGASAINEATITGESIPADKGKGAEVFAGTINITSLLKVKVSMSGGNTVLGKVRTLIIKAQETKLPIMRLIDRYMGWYTPLVVMIAGTIFFFTKEASRAVTALMVSCPTAVILAMPTAMVAALSCAARLGVLIKNIGDLETSCLLSAVVFDKTGTLTTGELAVKRLLPVEGVSSEELLRIAASLERYSNHPVAKAIAHVAEEAELKLEDCRDFEEVAGRGVTGMLGESVVLIGREGWINEKGVDCSAFQKAGLEGLSMLYVAKGGECAGCIGMEDKTRNEARNAVEELKKLGIKQIMMFTGDKKAVAKRVSGELGCTAFEAECLPERKLDIVEEMKNKGYIVAVVGDGVNDAPALAAGDIGVAVSAAGNDIAINSATIALMSSDLGRFPFLIRLSHKTMRIVYQNLVFGILCVAAGLFLSAMGFLTPVMAAIFYMAGSLIVVFNSARLIGYS